MHTSPKLVASQWLQSHIRNSTLEYISMHRSLKLVVSQWLQYETFSRPLEVKQFLRSNAAA